MEIVRKIRRFIPIALLVVLVASLQVPVQAHNPSGMSLSYDIDSQTLLVEVTHGPVTGDHRIAQIQIWKNDVLVNTRLYEPPQETASGMDDVFNVGANTGDVLKATATCSISGSITEQITVGVDTTDTTTSDTSTTDTSATFPTEFPTLLVIFVAILAIGILGVVVRLLKR